MRMTKIGETTMNRAMMRYDYIQERWVIDLKGEEYEYDLHCGECFELYIGDKAIPCRLELSRKWYVVMENARFDLREDDQYTVNYR